MKSRLLAGLGAATLVATVLAGCSSAKDDSPSGNSGSGASSGKDFSVGLELTGAQNDGGYDEALYNGLKKAKDEYGIGIQVAENKTSPDTQTAAVQALAQTNDMVIVVSFVGDAIKPIAKQYPKVHFFTVDGDLDPSIPNLHSFRTNQGLAAYVAGVVSAKMTKSKVVGYVGASEIPATTGSYEGFKLGVASVDPSIKVLKTYTGSFVDSTAAKEATAAQIAQHADVVYTFLDSATDGAFAAAKAQNVKIFNITAPRCDDGSFVAGTDIVSPAQFVSDLIGDAIDGKFPTDKPEVTLANPQDQRVEMCPGYEQYQSDADKATQDINDGTVKLPASVV